MNPAGADGPKPAPAPRGLCPACRAGALHPLVELSAPVNLSLLLPTREQAIAVRQAPVRLAVCHACGLVTNTAFDAAGHDYGASYEETQAFSPRFAAYAEELVEILATRHPLRGADVLEIGCGRGDVLRLLARMAGARGVGVDPSLRPEHVREAEAEGVELVRAFFDAPHCDRDYALVLCRHTLEHVHDVRRFLERLHDGLARCPDAAVVFEVPDTMRILREGAFWDVFYEHCSYFTAGSLARAFRAAGFRPLQLDLVYDGQYVVLEAARDGSGDDVLPLEEPVAGVLAAASAFAVRLEETRHRWRAALAASQAEGRTAVVWGAGSKGVSFLTALGLTEEITCAVDVNPDKHGMFMPGTGHEIVPPARLAEVRPDLVVVMNPVYLDEIKRQLGCLGVSAEVTSL